MSSWRLVLPGIALLGLSLILFIAGFHAYQDLGDPVPIAAPEALRQVSFERAVTVTTPVDGGRRLYNIAANTDVRARAEMLSSSSPLNGVPLSNVPRDKWEALVGSYVSIDARTDGLPMLMQQKVSHFGMGGYEFVTEYMFVPLDRGNLWALSMGSPDPGPFARRGELPHLWTGREAGTFKGHFHQLKNFKRNQLTYSEIKRLYLSSGGRRADAIDEGWLIAEHCFSCFGPRGETNLPALYGSAWHVYVPFQNTNGEVWAQFPLNTDVSTLGSGVRGLWLPSDAHAFDPGTGRRVALVVAHPGTIEKFMETAWSRHWSGLLMLAAAFAALAGTLLLSLAWGVNPIQRTAVPIVLALALISSAVAYLELIGPLDNVADKKANPVGNAIAMTVALAIAIMWVMAIWYRRKRCREAGLIARRIPQFASFAYQEATQNALAARMNDYELFWAHILPDHTRQAKTAISRELQRRGYSQQDIEYWAPHPNELTVPPAVERPLSLRHYTALMRVRRWLFLGYLALAVGALSYLGVVSLMPGADLTAVHIFIVVFGLFLLSLVGLFSLLTRNRALRILLLRPFDEKKMTRALKRFVCKNIGRAGNVFTLSDRNYKPNWFFIIFVRLSSEVIGAIGLLVLGPLLRTSKRVATVKREQKFRKLQRHLLRKASPSFWSFIAANQAFNIRSTYSWWQMCIHMLMHSCEVIVVDLSKVAQGSAWELDQLHIKGLLNKCLFVVGQDHVSEVRSLLERYFAPGQWPTVYVYGSNGSLGNKKHFDAHLNHVMAAGLAGWGRT